MKICMCDKKMYIKEEYTNSIFEFNSTGLKVSKTFSNKNFYEHLLSEKGFMNLIQHHTNEESNKRYYSEKELLEPGNEKILYQIYKYIKKQQNQNKSGNSFINAKKIISTMLLFILIKNEQIKIKLQEIIKNEENIEISFEKEIEKEFENIKIYKNKNDELIIGDNLSQKIITIKNSSFLFRSDLNKNSKEIEYYELFLTDELWKIYKLLTLRIDPAKNDANRCLIGLYFLYYLLQNEEFKNLINETKKNKKFKRDEKMIEKYKNLF